MSYEGYLELLIEIKQISEFTDKALGKVTKTLHGEM